MSHCWHSSHCSHNCVFHCCSQIILITDTQYWLPARSHSSAPEDGYNNFPKHVELTGIINKPLLLHLVGCLYYLYKCCTVKQISDNDIYLSIKYLKSVLWRVVKRLSYIEEARCLKVNMKRVSNWVYMFIHT